MKRLLGMFAIGSLLVAAATVEAGQRVSYRATGSAGSKPKILLASAQQLTADAYLDAPPPAPGIPAGYPPAARPQPDPGMGAVGSQPMAAGPGVPLFDCVKYRDSRNIAPCAVPMLVSVKDPCACRNPCSCCEQPKCVMVEICVPNCGCPKISCRSNGARLRYDYGKYAVDITSRNGVVVVDYDD